MRYEFLIPMLLIAGIAVFSVFRKNGMSKLDPKEQAVRAVREIALRTHRKMEALRKERHKLVDNFARQVDAVRASKVKKDIESI